jgi:hypothetical protein
MQGLPKLHFLVPPAVLLIPFPAYAYITKTHKQVPFTPLIINTLHIFRTYESHEPAAALDSWRDDGWAWLSSACTNA